MWDNAFGIDLSVRLNKKIYALKLSISYVAMFLESPEKEKQCNQYRTEGV